MKRSGLKSLVIITQGGLFLLTFILYYFCRRNQWMNDLWNGKMSLPVIIYAGILSGVAIRFFGLIWGEAWTYFKEMMEKTVVCTLKNLDNSELLLISLFPAVVEELFFRGFLQSHLGIFWTSIIFSLLHWGLKKDLWVYGLYTFIISLFLGWLYVTTGSLITTMLAHLTNNLLAGMYIQKRVSF